MERLKIYIDRLKDGETKIIDDSLPSKLMEIREEELSFVSPIMIKGKTYIAEDHLIININVNSYIQMPCAICNEMTPIMISTKNLTQTIPLLEIKNAVYNYGPLIRESLLLELPSFAECKGGCEQRKKITPFLKKELDSNHFPFSDLE